MHRQRYQTTNIPILWSCYMYGMGALTYSLRKSQMNRNPERFHNRGWIKMAEWAESNEELYCQRKEAEWRTGSISQMRFGQRWRGVCGERSRPWGTVSWCRRLERRRGLAGRAVKSSAETRPAHPLDNAALGLPQLAKHPRDSLTHTQQLPANSLWVFRSLYLRPRLSLSGLSNVGNVPVPPADPALLVLGTGIKW